MAFSFTSIPARGGGSRAPIRDPFSKPPKAAGILTPPARNPFWGQAAGKPWDPARGAQVVSGPTQLNPGTPRPTTLPPGLNVPGAANPGQTAGTSATTTASQPTLPGVNPNGPPLDATALSNIAAHQFGVNQRVNTIANTDVPNLRGNLANAIAALNYQQPRDELGAEQAANRIGALYSSVYAQNLGNLIHAYATKGNDLTTAEGQSEGTLFNEAAGLEGGIPLYNAGQQAAAGQRAITQAENAPTPPASTAPKAGSKAISDRGPFKPTNQSALKQALKLQGKKGFSSTVRRVK